MDPPFTPFQIPEWTTLPTDDELVAAIVGSGGSAGERTDAELIARDLLLPRLRKDRTVRALLWTLRSMKDVYEIDRWWDSRTAFVQVAVSEAVADLRADAARFAAVRLKHALWPEEPFPEEWDDGATLTPATVASIARELESRMKEIEGRYKTRLPTVFASKPPGHDNPQIGTYRTVAIVRNHLHVALTGDYSVTCGSIFHVLSRRGVKTERLDVDHL